MSRRKPKGLAALVLLIGSAMPPAMAAVPVPDLASASFYPDTQLAADGRACSVVVAPSADPAAVASAQRLAAGMAAKGGVQFRVAPDTVVCPERLGPVADEYRQTNLIVVGNLHNNRAVFPLYVQFLCSPDAHYPGGEGYELRTVGNPWGTGKNVVVVGASTQAGLDAAVQALLDRLPADRTDALSLPHTVAIRPGAALKAEFDNIAGRYAGWPRPTPKRYYPLAKFWQPAFRYYWTGDPRWAGLARDYMRHFNAEFRTKYRVSHYDMETLYRAWDMIDESPLLTDEDRRTTAHNLALTLFHDKSFARGPRVHVGNTHTTLPTMAHWVACRYLRRTYPHDAALGRFCLEREAMIASFYRATAKTGYRDDKDTGGTSSPAVYMRWAAASGHRDIFGNGHARAALLFALSLNDPLGYDAGMGTYGAARIGSIYRGFSTLYMLQLAAFVYQDPALRWLARRMPNRSLALYGQAPFPFNTCGFSLPEGLSEEAPSYLHGLTVIPMTERRYQDMAGRKPMPPCGRAFDKLTFRSGFDASDQYLILQGNECKSRDANTIARYTDRGFVWLNHNTSQIGHYYRNGLFITDGKNDGMDEMAARLDAAGRFREYALTTSTLRGFCGADWQRAIFCRAGAWVVVLDRAKITRPGQYSAQMIWRMPVPGVWSQDQVLTATQGGSTFHLMSSEPVDATARFERPAGGPPDIYEQPFLLRQRKQGAFAQGDVVDFQNLLTAADVGAKRPFTLTRIDDSAALVRAPDGASALVGVAARKPTAGIEVDSGAYILTDCAIYLVGVRQVAIDGREVLSREDPLTAGIDLSTGTVALGHDAEALKAAAVTWRLPQPGQSRIDTGELTHRAQAVLSRLKRSTLALGAGKGKPPRAASARRAMATLWENADVGSSRARVRDAQIQIAGSDWSGRISSVFDGLIPVRAGCIMWPARETARFELSWHEPRSISEVILHMNEIGRRGDVAPARELDETRPVALTWLGGGIPAGRRKATQQARAECRFHPVYKNFVQAQKLLRIKGGVRATGLRLEIPVATHDWHERVAIGEIEIVADARGPLPIHQIKSADLDGDGTREWIVNAGEGFLTVVDSDGRTRWHRKFPAELSCIDVGDLDGDGKQEVLCGCYDVCVYALRADGSLMWQTDLNQLRDRTGRKFTAESPTPFGVGFWQPAQGVRRVLVGNYEDCLMVLDVGGRVVQQYYPGFSMFHRRFVDGRVDLDSDGLAEKLMCSMKYGAYGVIHALVANAKGEIVAHRNVGIPDNLPYVVKLLGPKRSLAGVVTPTGYGLYDLAKNFPKQQGGWASLSAWQSRGGRPIAAGLLHDLDGDGTQEYLLGGRDGFVSVVAMNGDRLDSRLLGEEILGLAALGSGEALRVFAATAGGLHVFDSAWRLVGAEPGPFAGVWAHPAGGRSILAATRDGRLRMLKLKW